MGNVLPQHLGGRDAPLFLDSTRPFQSQAGPLKPKLLAAPHRELCAPKAYAQGHIHYGKIPQAAPPPQCSLSHPSPPQSPARPTVFFPGPNLPGPRACFHPPPALSSLEAEGRCGPEIWRHFLPSHSWASLRACQKLTTGPPLLSRARWEGGKAGRGVGGHLCRPHYTSHVSHELA